MSRSRRTGRTVALLAATLALVVLPAHAAIAARSATSVVASADDSTPPVAVSDLSVSSPTTTTARLGWTAPGDDGSAGTADAYDVRYATSPIADDAAFAAATAAEGTPTPSAAGTAEHLDLPGLAKGTTYYIRLKTRDAAGNWSALSNQLTFAPRGAGAVIRLQGADRYATSAAVSAARFASASTVVVVSGRSYADALSASGLAGLHDAPLLLADASLSASVSAEITRLGATKAFIVGGTGVVSPSVASALQTHGLTVERIAGADRYATAAAVALEMGLRSHRSAFFVRGDSFADGLAVAPIAYARRMPVLLVKGGSVPAVTTDTLGRLRVDNGVIAGGTGVVSPGVASALGAAIGRAPERWAGADRNATAVDAAAKAVAKGWASYDHVGFATGLDFADALAGGAATGSSGGVVLLTKPTVLPIPTQGALTGRALLIEDLTIYGGEGAVSTNLQQAMTGMLLFP